MLDLRGATPAAALSLLRASPLDTAKTDRFAYRPTLLPGCGYGLTTYSGDGHPLPSFWAIPCCSHWVATPTRCWTLTGRHSTSRTV